MITGYRIETVTAKRTVLYLGKGTVNGRQGNTIMMAGKFATWSWRQLNEERITGLEMADPSEFSVPSFVNLTELKQLDIPLFFDSLVFYLTLKNKKMLDTLELPTLSLATSSHKTPQDMIFDSLLKAGLLETAMEYVGSENHQNLLTVEGRRTLFHRCILKSMKNGFLWIYERCYVLHPTDPMKYLKRAIPNKIAMTNRPTVILPGDDHN